MQAISSLGVPALDIAALRAANAEGHISRLLATMVARNTMIALFAAYRVFPFLSFEAGIAIVSMKLHAICGE